jgi:putative DNA primase/helicase
MEHSTFYFLFEPPNIMKYDGTVEIAIGRSRLEKKWKNKEMLWSELVNRLKKTHRTHEGYKEYIAMKPSRQDTIKDIGGFVGGPVIGGRRQKGAVLERQVLTLDLDKVEDTEKLITLYANTTHSAFVLYSTHKHSEEAPRLRLVVPLSRVVNADEYEAIGRMIASLTGIEQYDPTGYQFERLMYWPSTAKDGDYFFHVADHAWLNPDAILEQYIDWQDVNEWPRGEGEVDKPVHDAEKQADPLTKAGLIGAFCRTYTIQEAIEKFLNKVYAEGTIEDRYTYVAGSTGNGAVVYDNKFLYSHHSTDPCGSLLVNAYDLVRIHKFRHLDKEEDEKEGISKLPSVIAMNELIQNDKRVKRTIGKESIDEARAIFADDDSSYEEGSDDWMEDLEIDTHGQYLSTINNVVLILENDPQLRGHFRWNDFSKRQIIKGKLPWKRKTKDESLTDSDMAHLWHYIELVYGLSSIVKIDKAIDIVCQKWLFNPVKDWIQSKEWDRVERAETLFIDYLGASDNSYIRTVTRKWLAGCIARIYEPGCKFDNMPIIIGDQGIGKSTLLRKLGHIWFTDSLGDLKNKDSFELIQGVWIVEMGELDSMRRAELETVKHFLSKQDDRFRVSYGRRSETYLRQCLFIGTTNEAKPLKDKTGNRRFWPLPVNLIAAIYDLFKTFTEETAQQVWAEVYGWYMVGEDLFLKGQEKIDAAKVQGEHMEEDNRIGALEDYLNTKVPVNWREMLLPEKRVWLQDMELRQQGTVERTYISVAEIWCEFMNKNLGDLAAWNTKDIHLMMKNIEGWEGGREKMKRIPQYGRQWVYTKR